ncbi:reverse transcriptase domain-containing protein [Psychrilyobacter atlanticus]|uniref:reverse transcriptase domain-containing protein n=1 Tax=Psychrilyobacter atlanticus TaxID=271091 RepID=UPI0004219675|nr:reverse transcriptase domain-containing protein [Psychrilyobacter atlanticus]
MKAYQLFNNIFKKSNLLRIYTENVQYKAAVGNDKINHRIFKGKLMDETILISKKVFNNSYNFTTYRQKLILKGKKSNPREVSICTIRDKITLVALKEVLQELFKNEIKTSLVQTYIYDIKKTLETNKYDSFIKLDLENYYGTINHKKLFKILGKNIRKKEILTLINKSITTGTCSIGTKCKIKNTLGIPQGLPISNVLSTIYLKNFDKKHLNNKEYKYFRYVDDIFIFCNKENVKTICNSIIEELQIDYKLKVHPIENGSAKSSFGLIKDGFSYLGYVYTGKLFTIRSTTINKMENRLENLLNDYKLKKDKKFFDFVDKFNFKITGFISENEEKYGWLFFFSQLEDLTILYKLDNLVIKLFKRHDLETKNIRKFSKSFHEILYNRDKTKYIPNFSKYTTEEKKEILIKSLGGKVEKFSEDDIKYEFKKYEKSLKKEMERDLQGISYL